MNQSVATDGTWRVAPAFLLSLLGVYLFLDGAFVYLLPIQKALYVAIALSAGFTMLVGLTALRLSAKIVRFILGWLVLLCAFLIPALDTDYVYAAYVLGDFVSLLLPLLLLLAGLRYQEIFADPRALIWLGFCSMVGAIAALPLAEVLTRHEPPATLLIAMGWVGLAAAGTENRRIGAIALLIVLLALAITSGERTAILLWAFLGVVTFLLTRGLGKSLGWMIAATSVVVVVLGIAGRDLVVPLLLEQTRLTSLAEGEVDESVLNRLLEAQDVFLEHESVSVVGLGHGATYVPHYSLPLRNLTEHGRAHHVHIGPMMLYLRYGLVGILMLLALVFDMILFARRLKRSGFVTSGTLTTMFYLVALTGYLASFLLFNILPDPAFSFVLGGYMYCRFTQPLPRFGVLVTNSVAKARGSVGNA